MAFNPTAPPPAGSRVNLGVRNQMKTLHHILIAFAAIAVAEMILYWVISSNLEAGVYPVEADSIGIPLFSSLIFAVASLILIVLAILCQLGPKWLKLLGVLLFLASAAITGLFAFSWASPNHYLITASYGIVSIGAVMAAFFAFRSNLSSQPTIYGGG